MQELEATWGRAARVWWLIVWRGVLGATLVGTVVGIIVGVVTAVVVIAMGGTSVTLADNPTYQIGIGLGAVLGLVIGIFWYILVVRMALRKQYREFRLAIVPRTDV
jgi:hypothetical protein